MRARRVAELIYIAMRLSLFVAMCVFLLRHEWVSGFETFCVALLMLLPFLLKRRFRVYLPHEVEFSAISFIYLTLFLGELDGFYKRFPWWDKLLHFSSGILFGIIGFLLIYLLNEQKLKQLELGPFFIAFFAACFAIAVGAVWEIYEFAADVFFGGHMQDGLGDTMGDLIFDTLGAVIVSSIAYVWMQREKRVPFTPTLLRRLRSRFEHRAHKSRPRL